MWLINVHTLRLEHFMSENDVPRGYTILSHTWGDDELTFDEFQLEHQPTCKAGFKKIQLTCDQTKIDGYAYTWVDTVCIDKRSSAELSEAINSMFWWYRYAEICYVYLEDVSTADVEAKGTTITLAHETEAELCSSRWFTRSWTLQELIAPSVVRFYTADWHVLGHKNQLIDVLHEVTRVDKRALRSSGALPHTSVAKRMSWAAKRTASRKEDEAYSLLGLFDIAMPMLYGEGGVKAFRRLQEEIIRTWKFVDHSMLAWAYDSSHPRLGIPTLSPSPRQFEFANSIASWPSSRKETFQVSHHGIQAQLRLSGPSLRHGRDYAALNCGYEGQPWTQILLLLSPVDETGTEFHTHQTCRVDSEDLVSCSALEVATNFSDPTSVLLSDGPSKWVELSDFHFMGVQCWHAHLDVNKTPYYITESYPGGAWDQSHQILSLQNTDELTSKHSQRYVVSSVGAMVILKGAQDNSSGIVVACIGESDIGNSTGIVRITVVPRVLFPGLELMGIGHKIFAQTSDSLDQLPMVWLEKRNQEPDKDMIFDINGVPSVHVHIAAKPMGIAGEKVWHIRISSV